MIKSRTALIISQVLAAVLFVYNAGKWQQAAWYAWFIPLILVLLIVVNSFWFTRFVSWIIFAGSFFCFLSVLSGFLIWRREPNFDAQPFYSSIIMYMTFVYVSMGQVKVLGGGGKLRTEGST